MKKLQRSQMTEVEALVLINQTIIMNAMAAMVSGELSDKLKEAADVTIKEVDRFEL